jgi:Tfp pilus assembly protein PilX
MLTATAAAALLLVLPPLLLLGLLGLGSLHQVPDEKWRK